MFEKLQPSRRRIVYKRIAPAALNGLANWALLSTSRMRGAGELSMRLGK